MQPSQPKDPWPVELDSGGSEGLTKAQPQWSSTPGRVRCHVGWTTLSPMAEVRPFRCSAATQREAQGQASET